MPELTASGDEEGEKTSSHGAVEVGEGNNLEMERVPSERGVSQTAPTKSAEDTASVREASQTGEPMQTNQRQTGEENTLVLTEDAEGGIPEDGEEPATVLLPRTVSSTYCSQGGKDVTHVMH